MADVRVRRRAGLMRAQLLITLPFVFELSVVPLTSAEMSADERAKR
jgi:hypothetical protein